MIDLGKQGRNVDFSNAASTRPFASGSTLPATCRPGDGFFRTGSDKDGLYLCKTANNWIRLNESGLADLPGTGFVTQTPTGTTTRSITVGDGIVIDNGDGQTGNVQVRADVASQAEAEGGRTSNKLMTPERTVQLFNMWNPVPGQTGKAGGLLTTDGTAPAWSWRIALPANGVQVLASAATKISADRTYVNVSPSADLTLTGTPVVASGVDGQFVTITNTSKTASVTLPDEANLTGSNLQLGGGNVTLAPRESITLVFSAALGNWVGNSKIARFATQTEAQAGLSNTAVMTPLRVSEAFAAWSPIPSQAGKSGGMLATDGTTPSWSWKLALPASGSQPIAAGTDIITADRTYVNLNPSSTITLTSTPTIADGSDGQFLTVTNVSPSASVTLQDEAVRSGSNLRLGGANITLAPRESLSLVFSAALGDWTLQTKAPAPPPVPAARVKDYGITCQVNASASGLNYGLANYPVPGCLTISNGSVIGAVPLAVDNDYVQGYFYMPASFTSLKLTTQWVSADATTSHSFNSSVSLVCPAAGESLDANLTGATAVTNSMATAGTWLINETAYDLTSAAASCAGKRVHWKLARTSSTLATCTVGTDVTGCPNIVAIVMSAQ